MKLQKVWIWMGLLALLYFGGRYLYFKPTKHAGEPVPAFTGTLRNGSSFHMEQLKGKIVLIDFWASWCGPCISQMAELRSLYEDFHGKNFSNADGFEIVTIAVEQSEDRWRTALQQFRPPGDYHMLDKVSSLRFFDGTLTKQLGVKRLPATFLLDAEGKIMGTNMSLEAMKTVLNSNLR